MTFDREGSPLHKFFLLFVVHSIPHQGLYASLGWQDDVHDASSKMIFLQKVTEDAPVHPQLVYCVCGWRLNIEPEGKEKRLLVYGGLVYKWNLSIWHETTVSFATHRMSYLLDPEVDEGLLLSVWLWLLSCNAIAFCCWANMTVITDLQWCRVLVCVSPMVRCSSAMFSMDRVGLFVEWLLRRD